MRTNYIYTPSNEKGTTPRASSKETELEDSAPLWASLLEPSDLEASSVAEVEEAGNIRDQERDCSIYRREHVEADGASVGAEVRAGVLHVCDVYPFGLRVQPHIMGVVGSR